MNLCEACGEDFGSEYAFSSHKIGKHEYLFSISEPARQDGRRCLSTIELKAKGWNRDKHGRWRTPPKAASGDGGTSSERRGEAA